MKKFTLFALAAIAATQAFAVSPENAGKLKAVKSEVAVAKKAMNAQSLSDAAAVGSRAEGNVTPATYPSYVVKNAFYIGMTQDRRSFMGKFGFLPGNSGKFEVTPVVDAESYEMSYLTYYPKTKEEIDSTLAANTGIVMPNSPMTQYLNVNMTYTNDATNYSYCDSVAEYFSGGDTYYWGFYSGEDEDNPTFSGMVGVTTFPFSGYTEDYTGVKAGGYYNLGQSAIDKTDPEYYDENGVFHTSWYSDNAFGNTYTDLKIVGYGTKVPYTGSPYLLSGVYAWMSYNITAETPIDVKVYPLDADGKPDTSVLLGKGAVILPKGANPLQPEVDGIVSVELSAVNSIGATNSPIVVDQDIYIEFTGMDAETVKTFTIIYDCTFNPLKADYANADLRKEYFNKILPRRAIIEFTGKTSEGIETTIYTPNIWYYTNPVNNTDYALIPSDFAMYLITDYPMIYNALQGVRYGELDVVIDENGGDNDLYFRSNYDFAQLYDDYEIEEEQSGDWFTYQLGYDEENAVCILRATAEALPEGLDGRVGSVHFTGYGYDVTIPVVQGDPSAAQGSINAIAADKAAQGKVFDLQGRAVKNATKGIYIVDGQKTILK